MHVVIVGVRDIDQNEKDNIRKSGITEIYTMRDIDERGMRTVIEEALRTADAEQRAITSRSIWIGSILKMRPVWERPCVVERHIAKRI